MSSQRTTKQHAVRRLHKDWRELEQEKEHLPTISALPRDNLFVWDCNLRPDSGPLAGTIFHLILRFPTDYPHSPPDVELCAKLHHPNVFSRGYQSDEGYYLCLDMLQSYSTGIPYRGWTSAYSLLSLLLQLQSFLFAENVPQDSGNTAMGVRKRKQVELAILAARNFQITTLTTHDGRVVKHTHDNPWPPLPKYSGEVGHRVDFTLEDYTSGKMQMRRAAKGMKDNDLLLVSTTAEKEDNHEEGAPKNVVSTVSSTGPNKGSRPLPRLPSDVYVHIFSFLNPQGLIKASDTCIRWRDIVSSYNLFERTQISCFHSKATLHDNDNTILGVGLRVEYYRDGKTIQSITSPLDVLSEHAFDVERVRTGVWGGKAESFDYFLPLVLNEFHGAKAVHRMEKTMYEIMQNCVLPSDEDPPSRRDRSKQREQQPQRHPRQREDRREVVHHDNFHPYMAFNLLAALMNSMVVELMNVAEEEVEENYNNCTKDRTISRYASEKALEGYCAFHHLLLFFAKRYPVLVELANKQIDRFLSGYWYRHKRQVPNLGILIICLTLSQKGWDTLRKPLMMEAFDRNVRWLLQKHPDLANSSIAPSVRLERTFAGTGTSLRLLMFQTYFMTKIATAGGPQRNHALALDRYNKQMGKPTAQQKEDLQRNAKAILAAKTWPQFFVRLGGTVPTPDRLIEILQQAIVNSERKRYHDPEWEEKRRARANRRRNDRERGPDRNPLTLGEFF